jgi:IstB-like ATP binding protein
VAETITERIVRNARELKLFGLAESSDELVERAEEGKLGYREFLDLVLEEEYSVVEGRRYASRLKLSALPNHKTLSEFDASFQPELDPKRLSELKSLRFVEKHLSTLILGPPGVGKTHIAVGIGMEALRRGYVVRYTTLDDLVRDLRKADQLGKLREKLSYYQRERERESAAAHLRRGRIPALRARGCQPFLPARQPLLYQRIDDRHLKQTSLRMGRSVRRGGFGCGDPRPAAARRGGTHHKRPFLRVA